MPRNNLKAIGGTGLNPPDQWFPPFPELPDDVKARFPSLREWEAKMQEWSKKAGVVINRKVSP